MSWLGSLISGAGEGAAPMGNQLREHQFQHQENALRLWQIQHQQLADAIERNAAKYQYPEGERLRDLQVQVNALPPGTDLTPYHAAYTKHTADAQKQLEKRAAMNATGGAPAGITPVETPPNYLNSNPFAKMIAQAPQPGGGALPATNPLTAPAPGGAGSPDAAFRAPAANSGGTPGPSGPASAPAPVPSPAQASAGGPEPAAPPAPIAGIAGASPLNFEPSYRGFNTTGYIDPVVEAMLPGQVGLYTAKQKVDLISPMIEGLPPQLQSLVKAEIIAGGSGMNSMASLMFAAPQKEFIDAGPLTPAQRVANGIPPDFKGKWTKLRDRFGNIVGGDPGWAGTATTTNEQGVEGRQSINDALANGLTAVGGGPSIRPGNLAPVNIGVDASGHPQFQSRGNILRDIAEGHPFSSAFQNPSFAPVTSTQTSPGAPPVTTIRVKGGGGASKSSAPGRSGGSVTPAGPGPIESSMPIGLRLQADRIEHGDETFDPNNRNGQAIAQIIAERQARGGTNTHEIPVPLTAAGETALAKTSAVLQQIKEIKSMISKVKDSDRSAYFLPDYTKYRLGHAGEGNVAELMSKLSMTGILGAGAILSQEGIRSSLPLFHEASIHVPNPLIDSPKTAWEKLNNMEDNLTKSQQYIRQFERKSGVPGTEIPPVQSNGSIVDQLLQKHGLAPAR